MTLQKAHRFFVCL